MEVPGGAAPTGGELRSGIPGVASPVVLYLVRHGRTAHNAGGRLLGRLDVDLDEVGRRQAAALGCVEALRSAVRVVSSPLARAVETASAIGPPVTLDERWAEIDYGDLDGAALSEVGDLFVAWERDLTYVPPGGESLAALGARVRGRVRLVVGRSRVERPGGGEPRLADQGRRGLGAGGGGRDVLADVPRRGVRYDHRPRS